MEIEVKYLIPDKETADRLWEDKYLASMEEAGTRETLYMKSAYFDTEDGVLSKHDIAFRVRIEGEYAVAALKWSGRTEGATHIRGEINVPIDGNECLMSPDVNIFKESEIGRDVIELISGRQLFSNVEVGVLRRRFRIDTGKAIIEVSIDNGEVITKCGNAPISEVEFELFSGDREALEELSETIKATYGLEAEEKSKYARGLELLAGKNI